MKQPNLKLRQKSKTRMVVEHLLTFAIWVLWAWSASKAMGDWKIVLFKAPVLPSVLEMGGIASVILMIALWVRSRFSLDLNRPKPLRFELDPSAEEKCMAILGWDREKLALAQNARSFEVSTGSSDMRCAISLPVRN